MSDAFSYFGEKLFPFLELFFFFFPSFLSSHGEKLITWNHSISWDERRGSKVQWIMNSWSGSQDFPPQNRGGWWGGGKWKRKNSLTDSGRTEETNRMHASPGWMIFLIHSCKCDSHVTWSLIPSSRADPGMTGFSDLHDKCFPLSLMSGMKETVEIVVLESLEWLSSTSFRVMIGWSLLAVPLNQVIRGFGRDPTDWHLNSILLPAMIELRGGISRTWSGFTVSVCVWGDSRKWNEKGDD